MSDTLSNQPPVSSGLSTTTADSDSETNSVAAGSTDSGPGPPKRKKYSQSFSDAWKGQLPWLSSSYKGAGYGFCLVCNKHLSCVKGGIRDLKRHSRSETARGNGSA